MCVVKNRSVSGCTFWLPGLLTLSPRDHWAFRRLPTGVTPRMRTPLPQCRGCRPRRVNCAQEHPLAQPALAQTPFLDPRFSSPTLFLKHSPLNAIVVASTQSHPWKSEFSAQHIELTMFLFQIEFCFPYFSCMVKLHTFGSRGDTRGQFKFLRIWIAGYMEKKRRPQQPGKYRSLASSVYSYTEAGTG